MAQSLKLLQSYVVENVRNVAYANGFLVLSGGNYQTVRYVLVNNVRIDDIALNGEDLYVQLPSGMQLRDVKTIYPISETEKVNRHSVLRFGFGVYPSKIDSIGRLVQMFVKVLFTNPGTNAMFPTMGGGLRAIMSRGLAPNDYQSLMPDIITAIEKTAQYIKDAQKSLNLPMEERLVGAALLSATPNTNSGSINCVIKLDTQAGNVRDFSLTF